MEIHDPQSQWGVEIIELGWVGFTMKIVILGDNKSRIRPFWGITLAHQIIIHIVIFRCSEHPVLTIQDNKR